MAAPFTPTAIVNYNANAPADDGSQVPSNRVDWATIKTKIGDPLKTGADTNMTAIAAAFAKIVGGSGVTTTATNYTVGASDAGKLVKVTGAATITTPDATVVTSPFVFAISNLHSATISLDGSGSQTIDGETGISVPPGTSFFLYTDGTNWFSAGRSSPAPVPATFKNLSIKVASNTTVTVAADFVVTTNGSSAQATAVSSTINLGTTGADALDTGTIAVSTWYAIHVIAKADGTTKCIASTSATSPTLPADYTFTARVGWVRTIAGSATLYGTWQLGRRAQFVVALAQTTVLPSLPSASGAVGNPADATISWGACAVGAVVPTTASVISIILYSGNGIAIIAPNGSYGGYDNATGKRPPLSIRGDVVVSSVEGSLLLESSNVYYAATGTQSAALVLGWEDNI